MYMNEAPRGIEYGRWDKRICQNEVNIKAKEQVQKY